MGLGGGGKMSGCMRTGPRALPVKVRMMYFADEAKSSSLWLWALQNVGSREMRQRLATFYPSKLRGYKVFSESRVPVILVSAGHRNRDRNFWKMFAVLLQTIWECLPSTLSSHHSLCQWIPTGKSHAYWTGHERCGSDSGTDAPQLMRPSFEAPYTPVHLVLQVPVPGLDVLRTKRKPPIKHS